MDFDLHGDGTVSILKDKGGVAISNPQAEDREVYLEGVSDSLSSTHVDILGVSAGFDNHLLDRGGLLSTEDYRTIGALVHEASERCSIGCFTR